MASHVKGHHLSMILNDNEIQFLIIPTKGDVSTRRNTQSFTVPIACRKKEMFYKGHYILIDKTGKIMLGQ